MGVKRIFDIVFSVGALIFFLPLAIVITLLILIFSPGPIFHLCQRVGKDRQIINCWKFRTMCTNAEEQLHTILATSPHLREEWYASYKLKNDPRITLIGKFLRKTSLDELPQFFNVLKGELSVVGPRPVTEEEVNNYYKNQADKILSIKPGMTGLWQTSGRNHISFEERVAMEAYYVDQQSFALDLKIILKTIKLMLFSLNGY